MENRDVLWNVLSDLELKGITWKKCKNSNICCKCSAIGQMQTVLHVLKRMYSVV